jgi:pantothenate kinase
LAWLIDWKLRLLQVEHIIREENMMAAQEILELFCELIAVRLPIIEAQKFVPLSDFHLAFTTRNCSCYLLVHVTSGVAIETSCSFIAPLDKASCAGPAAGLGFPVAC